MTPEFQGHVQSMLAGAGKGWRDGYEPNGALFGVGGSYLITCKGGRHLAWNSNLEENYPILAGRLRDKFKGAEKEGKVVCNVF